MGLIPAVEGLKAAKWLASPEQENSPADCFQTAATALALLALQTAGHTADFGLANLGNHVSQFLIINLSLSPHNLLVLFVWRTLINADTYWCYPLATFADTLVGGFLLTSLWGFKVLCLQGLTCQLLTSSGPDQLWTRTAQGTFLSSSRLQPYPLFRPASLPWGKTSPF